MPTHKLLCLLVKQKNKLGVSQIKAKNKIDFEVKCHKIIWASEGIAVCVVVVVISRTFYYFG